MLDLVKKELSSCLLSLRINRSGSSMEERQPLRKTSIFILSLNGALMWKISEIVSKTDHYFN
jgi:hypothetical protein